MFKGLFLGVLFALVSAPALAQSNGEANANTAALERMRDTIAQIDAAKGPDSTGAFLDLLELARLQTQRNELHLAEELYREMAKRRRRVSAPDDYLLHASINNLGNHLKLMGNYREAEELLRESLELREAAEAIEDKGYFANLNNLAQVAGKLGRYKNALALFERSYAASLAAFGKSDKQTLIALDGIADYLDLLGRHAESEEAYRKLLEADGEVTGPNSRNAQLTKSKLAENIMRQGRWDEAELMLGETLQVLTQAPNKDDRLIQVVKSYLARVAGHKAQFLEAKRLSEDILAAREKIFPPDHPSILASKSSLAFSMSALGFYREAEALLREVAKSYERTLGDTHTRTLISYGALAAAQERIGQSRNAEALYRKALVGHESTMGPDSLEALESAELLADFLVNQDQFGEAEALYRRVIEGHSVRFGEDFPATKDAELGLASLLKKTKRFAEAEPMLRAVLAYRTAQFGEDNLGAIFARKALAGHLLDMSRFNEAEPLYRSVHLALENALGSGHPNTLSAMTGLAQFYQKQGRYGEAESAARGALKGLEAALSGDHIEVTVAQLALAAALAEQGKFSEAERYYVDARAANERLFGLDHTESITTTNNLAVFYRELGRYDDAAALFEDARQRAVAKWGRKDLSTLHYEANLARTLAEQGKLDKAEPLYQSALEGRAAQLGVDNPQTLWTRLDLVRLQRQRGDLDAADATLSDLTQTLDRAYPPSHPLTLAALSEAADLGIALERYQEGTDLTLKALLARLRSVPFDHPDVAADFRRLAQISAQTDADPAKTVYLYKAAVTILQVVRQNIVQLDKQTQRSFLNKHRATYLELQEAFVQQGRFAEAEQVGRMLKDVEYTAFVRGATDLPEGDQLALTRQESDWDAQLTRWLDTPNAIAGQLAALRSKEREEGDLSALEQKQLADLDQAYGAAYEEFFTLVTDWTSEAQTFDSARIEREVEELELQKSRALQRLVGDIGSDVALMQAVAFDDSLHLFFITGEAFVHEEVPVTRSELFQTIFAARSVIDKGRSNGASSSDCRATLLGDDESAGVRCSSGARMSEDRAEELQVPLGQLYQWLIAPLEDELAAAGTKTLMLNLQGQIRYVPFAALWDGNAYLTEKLQLAFYTPAANTRYEAAATLSQAQGFGLSNAVSGFSPLPGVPRELDYVIGTAAEPGILAGEYVLNEGFDRASFERKLADPAPVVHIATHFHLKPGDEAASYLLLGDGSKVSVAAINRSYKYNFDGVELLTLSACETALGAESTGMEIEGFGALAQNKGAASVVASLWLVSDLAAPELMRSFYRGMVEDKLTKAAALQRAQIEMIQSKDFADPFNWAPFVIMGNWR